MKATGDRDFDVIRTLPEGPRIRIFREGEEPPRPRVPGSKPEGPPSPFPEGPPIRILKEGEERHEEKGA